MVIERRQCRCGAIFEVCIDRDPDCWKPICDRCRANLVELLVALRSQFGEGAVGDWCEGRLLSDDGPRRIR